MFIAEVRKNRGMRDGSVVKSTGCSSREAGFNSQDFRGSLHLAVIPVPGDPTPSYRHACKQNNNAHTIKKSKFREDVCV